MKQEHSDLIDELKAVSKPIIEKYIKEKNLDVADIVYCSCFSSEEIALRIKREMEMNKGEHKWKNQIRY